jgi:hypothetical protein
LFSGMVALRRVTMKKMVLMFALLLFVAIIAFPVNGLSNYSPSNSVVERNVVGPFIADGSPRPPIKPFFVTDGSPRPPIKPLFVADGSPRPPIKPVFAADGTTIAA